MVMSVMMAVALVQAGVLFDFVSAGSGVKIANGAARYRDEVAERQLNPTSLGLEVRGSAKHERAPTRWMELVLPKSGCSRTDLTDGAFRLVLAAPPCGRFASNFAVNLIDRDGEIFQVMRRGEGYDDEGFFFVDFDARDLPKGTKGWGTPKANGVKDPPLTLHSLAIHYRSGAAAADSGEVTFLRIDEIDRQAQDRASAAVPRRVVSREPISTDTMYPGAKPFPGARRLCFRVEPPFDGTAKLTLSRGLKQDGLTHGVAAVSNGLARFSVDLPYGTRYQFVSLRGTSGDGADRGPLKVTAAGGEFVQTSAEAMRLRVETGNPLHLVRDGKDERPRILISNPAAEDLSWTADIVLRDYFGKEVRLPFARRMKAGEEVAVDVPWPLPARGLWRIRADVKGDDGSTAVKEDRFAWIDLHEVTPVVDKPKFRMGIHYHGTHYWPGRIDLTIAGLVAAGAKFTRCDYDHMWSDIERRPGDYSWEKADTMVGKLRAAGLALDIIFAGTPSWAFDPAAVEQANRLKDQGYRVRNCCYLPREGLFRDFCEKYARRYGTQIDYYECGNEWDLTGQGTVSYEGLLRVQREAYEGLHAGCPGVCVIPNGWTRANRPEGDPKVWQQGLLEYFAEHPETYDAWALHCHGAPEDFFVNLSKRFLPMRESKPLMSRPWLLNETALSCANGKEDEVASAVWQKIVYGWAAGARDYIWYNLRATGWFEGSEPGYGLLTADFRPRAGYAAFSALSTVLQGMDFDATLHSEGLRHLFRFRGSSQALSGGQAVVGWDTLNPGTVCRLDTDAKSAAVVDLMGNRTPVAIDGGKVTFVFGLRPQALLLEGATRTEVVDRAELTRADVRAVVVHGTSRRPDIVLDTAANVKDLYEANPAETHRLWKGRSDHSARLWFVPGAGGFTVRALVQDDVRAAGDFMDLTVSEADAPARRFRLTPRTRKGECDSYEQFVKTDAREVGVQLVVHDDDGEGEDSALFLMREGAGPLLLRFE